MIEARHTLIGTIVANLYSGSKMNRAFRETTYIGEWNENGLPILMLSNHFSWWDGFIQYRLNRTLFNRKLYVMMLEEQLRKNVILNKCGCFSIRKNSRSIIETLDYCLDIVKERDNMLLIFPQGEIQSMHTEWIKFESGLRYLLKHIENDVNVVFNVNLIDYFSEKRPALNIYFKASLSTRFLDMQTLEKEYNAFYTECKNKQNVTK